MILIGFQQASPANTLCAYLNTQRIPCKVVAEHQQFQIYLKSEADLEPARQIASAFVHNPNDPRFQSAAWEQGVPANINGFGTGTLTRLTSQLKHAPVVTVVLVFGLLNYFLAFGLGQFQIYELLRFQPWSEVAASGEIWRLLSPALLHFSAMHLLFNLGWWFMLGRDIENTLGRSTLIMLFVASGLLSNYAQFIDSGPNFGGLSGVVYALLGFCWWLGWLKPQWQIQVPRPVVGFMLVWLLIGYADVLWIEMANTAHLVGLISGCALALLYSRLRRESSEN